MAATEKGGDPVIVDLGKPIEDPRLKARAEAGSLYAYSRKLGRGFTEEHHEDLSDVVVSDRTVLGWLETMPPKCPGCRQSEGMFHLASCDEPANAEARIQGFIRAYPGKISDIRDPDYGKGGPDRYPDLGPMGGMSDDQYRDWYAARQMGAHVITHDKPDMRDPHRRAMYPDPYPHSYKYPSDTKLIDELYLERLDRMIEEIRHTHSILTVIAGLLQAQAERDPMAIMEAVLSSAEADFDTSGGPPGS